MVNTDLVKRKRRKKIAKLVGVFSSMGIVIFMIVAFLGRFVGSFTVSVSTRGQATLSMYDNKELQNPTTFIRVRDIPEMSMYSATKFVNEDLLDSTDTDYTYGASRDSEGNIRFLYFLKYTFYIQNTGGGPLEYELAVNVVENTPPDNDVKYDLLDLSRLRFYANAGETNEHKFQTFAKASPNKRIDESGNETYNKPIAGEPGTAEYCGFAELYESDKVMYTYKSSKDSTNNFTNGIQPNQVVRHTVILWLEGEDENSHNEQPTGCSLKIGIEIKGYDWVEEK